jgi:hypothetical protein
MSTILRGFEPHPPINSIVVNIKDNTPTDHIDPLSWLK